MYLRQQCIVSDSTVLVLLKSALNSLLSLCYLVSDIYGKIMSDADRYCARLHYQFQEKTFQFFFKATMPTLGPLSLAPNVFALNYNFVEECLRLCP